MNEPRADLSAKSCPLCGHDLAEHELVHRESPYFGVLGCKHIELLSEGCPCAFRVGLIASMSMGNPETPPGPIPEPPGVWHTEFGYSHECPGDDEGDEGAEDEDGGQDAVDADMPGLPPVGPFVVGMDLSSLLPPIPQPDPPMGQRHLDWSTQRFIDWINATPPFARPGDDETIAEVRARNMKPMGRWTFGSSESSPALPEPGARCPGSGTPNTAVTGVACDFCEWAVSAWPTWDVVPPHDVVGARFAPPDDDHVDRERWVEITVALRYFGKARHARDTVHEAAKALHHVFRPDLRLPETDAIRITFEGEPYVFDAIADDGNEPPGYKAPFQMPPQYEDDL